MVAKERDKLEIWAEVRDRGVRLDAAATLVATSAFANGFEMHNVDELRLAALVTNLIAELRGGISEVARCQRIEWRPWIHLLVVIEISIC